MRHTGAVAFLSAIFASLATAALAHGGEDLVEGEVLEAWSFDPLLVGLIALSVTIYLRGAFRRRRTGRPIGPWRHVAFATGLVLVALALLSPIDAVAERLFWVHQVQHMLLRVAGPMLIMLAAPQAAMFAGTPRLLRSGLIRPVLLNGIGRSLFGWLARPSAAFAIFVASLYVWEVPALHNAAILDPAIHYLMHVTMLAAGVLFFWVIFDPRDPPKGIPYGIRHVMLFGTVLSNILLGAMTTLKTVVLYDAYDLHGRLFGFAPLEDERFGGILIWWAMSMMSLVAMLIVFKGWNRFEERCLARGRNRVTPNSAIPASPRTAGDVRIATRPVNRRIAFGLAMLPVALFALVITVAVTLLSLGNHPLTSGTGQTHASAPAGPGADHAALGPEDGNEMENIGARHAGTGNTTAYPTAPSQPAPGNGTG